MLNYKIGILVDKPSEKNDTEGNSANQQKQITAEKIKEALCEDYELSKITADKKIIEKLRNSDVDIVFNLSTGVRGGSRQSQIPAIMEMIGIPYVGSGVLTHAMALNKAVAKKMFLYHNVLTPRFQVFATGKEEIDTDLNFPIIVKPACEGSGFGIHKDSVVNDKESLLKKVEELLKEYRPPILAEEFIKGREFTVGIIGNGDKKRILPIMEIDFKDIPEEYGKFYTFEVKSELGDQTRYYCPASLNKEQEKSIKKIASKAFDSLGCRDLARIDIILKGGTPYVIEVNSLPGLQPVYSDLPKMADAAGISYKALINRILEESVKRIKSKERRAVYGR